MSSSSRITADDPRFGAAFRALAEANWTLAVEHFRAGLAEHPLVAEAWEGLAAAAWWAPQEDTVFEARERAYHLYLDRGDEAPAAVMAAWLACDSLEMRGQTALANGWMQRALRLISKHPATPDCAWVTQLNARLLQMQGSDLVAIRRLAGRTVRLARQLKLAGLEGLALALEGHARLSAGEMGKAVKCLDEAAAVVLSGETEDLTATALTLCSLMGACERMRDFERAREWCAAATQFSEQRGFPIVLSVCRPHYGAVLMRSGQWREAEEHLEIGRRELTEFVPEFAVGAISLLGSLRWRQGRWDEAQRFFESVKSEAAAQVGYAELLASKGETEAAIDILERHLRTSAVNDQLEAAPTLELLVRCLAARGNLDAATERLKELQTVTDSLRTLSIRATYSYAEGTLARATGNLHAAHECLSDAVLLFERAAEPFESGRSRIALAEVLYALGRADAAAREAEAARDSLARMGAAREEDRAGRLLVVIAREQSASQLPSPGHLTVRERQVLELLAQGRSNQQIADSLVLSVRTVERHISNIYQKLGLEGRNARTAAAALFNSTVTPG